MEMSNKRREALYEAIREPILKQRIAVGNSKNILGKRNADAIETLLLKLNNDIWDEVKQALNIR